MRHAIIALTLATVACGGSTAEPAELLESASLSIVAGADQADSIEARLDPVTVELTTAQATAISGIVVNFVVTEPDCGAAFAGSAITDASGLAADLWDLGTVAKECTMEVRAVDPDGTPRVFATTTATVQPGSPVAIDFGPGPAVVFAGEPTDVAGTARDRAGNATPVADVAWTAREPLVSTGSVIDMPTEAAGWLVGQVGSVVDSTEVWVLYDLGALGGEWAAEHWTRFGDPTEFRHGVTHDGCSNQESEALLDSLHSTMTFGGVVYDRSDRVLSLDNPDSTQTTFWCRNGTVVEESIPPMVSDYDGITVYSVLRRDMQQRPGKLDGLVGKIDGRVSNSTAYDADAGPFDALDTPGHYQWTGGSTAESPFRRDSTLLRPAG